MRIEFLYFADCPSHEEALDRLHTVLDAEGVSSDVEVTEVLSEEEAQALRFVGSPTIRINGQDIDPTTAVHTDYSLTCRTYIRPDGRFSPLPPLEMIRAAVRAALTA